jgi:hypothetical protein
MTGSTKLTHEQAAILDLEARVRALESIVQLLLAGQQARVQPSQVMAPPPQRPGWPMVRMQGAGR